MTVRYRLKAKALKNSDHCYQLHEIAEKHYLCFSFLGFLLLAPALSVFIKTTTWGKTEHKCFWYLILKPLHFLKNYHSILKFTIANRF